MLTPEIIRYVKSITEQIDILRNEIDNLDKFQRLREEVLVEISNYIFDITPRINKILDVLDYKKEECRKNNNK